MKIHKLIALFFLVFMTTCIIISACSQSPYAQDTNSEEMQTDYQLQPVIQSPLNLGESSVEVDHSVPDAMRVFEGEVFVASTKPKTGLWKSAGWRIAKHPHSADGVEVPSDCTLYPHKGVENQWIGNCSGFIYIPIEGAKHIAVILTHPDGNTTHIQVSPIPDQQ